jgi:hypothetical protein
VVAATAATTGMVARTDLSAFDLVGIQQAGPAPSLDGAGQLPLQIHRVADAGVHSEPALRDDQMCGITGQEHSPVAVTIGEQKVQTPRVHGEHFNVHQHADYTLDHRHEIRVLGQARVQGEVPLIALHHDRRSDHAGIFIGDVEVPSLTCERDPLNELVRAEEDLTESGDIALTLQLAPQCATNGAGAAVTADEKVGS